MTIRALIAHLPVEYLPAPNAQGIYSADTGGASRQLRGAIVVKDAAAIEPLLGLANQHRWKLWPISGGRNFGYGTSLPAEGDSFIVDLRALKGIEYHAASQAVTVEAGVTQQDLRDFLDANGLKYLVPTTGAGPHGSLIGNALDGGYGLTPVSDHFEGLSRLQGFWGAGAPFDHSFAEQGSVDMAHRWPAGVGPDLRPLLRQSNLGLVVKATIMLARVPDAAKLLLIRWPSEAAFLRSQSTLSVLMEQIPQLTGVMSMHSSRTLAALPDSPLAAAPADKDARDAFLATAAQKQKLTEWTSLGTLFGTEKSLKGAVLDIKRLLPEASVMALSVRDIDRLGRIANVLPERLFSRLKKQVESLRNAKGLLTGTPVAEFLQLAYSLSPAYGAARNESNPAKDGVGLLWHAPLVPLTEAGIHSFIRRTKTLMNSYGFDALLATTTRTSRVCTATIPILFDRQDPKQVARAHACLKALQWDCLQMGTPPYRMGIDSMENWNCRLGPATKATWRALKRTLDPNSVLAPGRYIR